MADDSKTNMISFEELLKLQKSGQGTLMTSVKDKNGNQLLLNVYGETADRLTGISKRRKVQRSQINTTGSA